MKNVERLVKQRARFQSLDAEYDEANTIWLITYNAAKIGSYDGTGDDRSATILKKWLDQEFANPILTYEERQYLSNVIKPFYIEVRSISKMSDPDSAYERIVIQMNDLDSGELPKFTKGAMYKGMEKNRLYTIDELNIKESL